MKQNLRHIIFRHGSEKSPVCQPIEIAPRFYLTADSSEINHQGESPRHEPNRTFRNPALCAAVIRDWPGNPGLCSSRAVEVWWPELPATSPFLCATSSPAGRSNSWGCPSRPTTVMRTHRKCVFTQTQMTQKCHIFPLADRGPFF